MNFFFFAVCIPFVLSNVHIKNIFYNWTKEHNVVYPSEDIESYRYAIFKENVEWINQRNTELKHMTVGMNAFGDMTQEEFASIYLHPLNESEHIAKLTELAQTNFSSRLDLNNVPVGNACTTAVRNQGHCGSCADFSATGAIEGLMCLPSTNGYAWISPQEAVDCWNKGCHGTWPVDVLHFLGRTGFCRDSDYQYVSGRTGKANDKCYSNICKLTGIQGVFTCHNGRDMAAALNARNFVSITIDAGGLDFQFYKSGKFMPGMNCNSHNVNHAVLAVAIEGRTSPDVNCQDTHYIVKNSWGSSWGQAGYFHLPAGCNCLGVANHPSVFPIK